MEPTSMDGEREVEGFGRGPIHSNPRDWRPHSEIHQLGEEMKRGETRGDTESIQGLSCGCAR